MGTDTEDLIVRLRDLAAQEENYEDDVDRSVECVDMLRAAADALEALGVERTRLAAAARLFLRSETEGHFTLLLEGPGTPRVALGILYRSADTDGVRRVIKDGAASWKISCAIVDAYGKLGE